MKWIKTMAVIGLLLPFSVSGQTDITTGTWYNVEKTGRLQFFIEDSKLNGKIVWMKDPEKKDANNPDAKLRSRTILGITNLTGFVTKDKKSWTDGKIYDPESGKTYSSKITVINDNELDVRGYIGTPLFGRTTKFTRAE